MKVTQENYFDIARQHQRVWPDAFEKGHEMIELGYGKENSWSFLSMDDSFQRVADLQFDTLGKWLTQQEESKAKSVPTSSTAPSGKVTNKPSQKPTNEAKADAADTQPTKSTKTDAAKPKAKSKKPRTQSKKPKATQAPKTKTVPQEETEGPERVKHLSAGIPLIKSLLGLHEKKVEAKRLIYLFRRIEKALVEDKLQAFRDEVEEIRDKLADKLNKLEKAKTAQISVNTALREALESIVSSEALWESIPLIKRFIGLKGDKPPREKAERLLKAIQRKFEKGSILASDPNQGKLKEIEKYLSKYLASKSATIGVSSVALNGLAGVVGMQPEEVSLEGYYEPQLIVGVDSLESSVPMDYTLPLSDQQTTTIPSYVESTGMGLSGVPMTANTSSTGGEGFMSAEEVRNQYFDIVQTQHPLSKAIGEYCFPTTFFAYGPGGSGKSSVMLHLADHLATLGFRAGHIAGEQYGTPTLQKMYHRYDIKNVNTYRDVGSAPMDQLDIALLDSKDALDVEVDDFKRLLKQHKNIKLWVVISQATKDEGFTGSEKWRNLVETMIFCKDMVAHVGLDKNRWGGRGQVNIADLIVNQGV